MCFPNSAHFFSPERGFRDSERLSNLPKVTQPNRVDETKAFSGQRLEVESPQGGAPRTDDVVALNFVFVISGPLEMRGGVWGFLEPLGRRENFLGIHFLGVLGKPRGSGPGVY